MGPYEIVYCDPPWRFQVWDKISGEEKSPENHYQTMTDEELSALPVSEWVAKDALMPMWVVDPHLPFALQLARTWGFEFVTVLFRWLKVDEDQRQLAMFPIHPPTPAFGLGYHTRGGGCEEVWLFRRGKGLPVLRHDIRKEFYAQLREHSRKPDEVRQWIVDLYGNRPRLEMFARQRADGWDAFGNQLDKFAPVPSSGASASTELSSLACSSLASLSD